MTLFFISSPLAAFGRGAGLAHGLLDARVELALRDDARVHVHEDAVDDLAGPERHGDERDRGEHDEEKDTEAPE